MFSRLVSSAIRKLADHVANDVANDVPPEPTFPTLPFPPPPPTGPGTRRLCGRCLTLLHHVVFAYGDGTGCESLEMPHSASMSALSGSFCVVCAKMLLLFDGMRKHVSFHDSLRDTPLQEWSLTWNLDAPETVTWLAYNNQAARVSLMVKHKGGYSWGIGSFLLHPDPRVTLPGAAERKALPDDHGTILPLDGAEEDFSSTLSNQSMALVASWMQECYSTHKKCHQLFGKQAPGQSVAAWFPDRLIRITRTEKSGADWLSTRLVIKSDSADYPAAMIQEGVDYLSFSHCWGPAPKEGRGDSVLTKESLAAWRKHLPLEKMPLAFQHAIKVCAALGFDHIWIDSLCIIQNSVPDWEEQSAVMADVYKFAWLNIAALSTASDYEGFINDNRNPRVVFGFRSPLAPILGRHPASVNHRGRPYVLLHGEAKLLWYIQSDLPGGGSHLAPLFTRAWVYQERSLARRTLAFATHGVFFACDEASYGENLDCLSGVSSRGSGPRHLLHSMLDASTALAAEAVASGTVPSPARMQAEALALMKRFGSVWGGAISTYTECGLTKDTDRLVAISSVARELANSGIVQQQRYLAGLWDVNLVFQLAWLTCAGRETTARRKRVGAKGYVAPSWSWASIEAPVVPSVMICPDESRWRALAEVRAADVALATSFAFGPVSAGWLRLWGCLKAVSSSETKPNYDYEESSISTSLTDAATGERLWFCSDTTEGYEMVASRAGLNKVVWVPLLLEAHSGMVSCQVLVLAEVPPGEGYGGGGFVKPGDKVYRRLGMGSFGRIPSLFRKDKILMNLGWFPETEDMAQMVRRFRRNETDYREFVII